MTTMRTCFGWIPLTLLPPATLVHSVGTVELIPAYLKMLNGSKLVLMWLSRTSRLAQLDPPLSHRQWLYECFIRSLFQAPCNPFCDGCLVKFMLACSRRFRFSEHLWHFLLPASVE